MYYCTIYKQSKLSDKNTCEVFICLSYLDKADAEKYQQNLIQQAIESGGRTYLTEGNYTTITGKILLKPTGITSNRSGNHYRIGIESESTKFSIIPAKAKALIPAYKVTDGLAYEIYVEDTEQRQLTELLARQEIVSENINKFTDEIKPMTDIYQVLRSFVKYSNKKSDKELLTTIAVEKLQELV
jgi:hypothetical protein